MRFYTVEAFRKSLGEILDRVRFSNEPATITKRKKPIVVITPVAEPESEKVVSEPVLGTRAPPLPTVKKPKSG